MIKILRISIFMFIILIMNNSLSAQESAITKDNSAVTHELGINATFFIQQFISLGTSTNVNTSPYAITYRRIKSNRGIFRAGFGMTGFSSQSEESQQTLKTSSYAFNTRLGIERQFDIAERWSVSVGGDLRNSFEYQETRNPQFQTDFTAIDESYGVGIGPILGIRFNLGQRIGLYTETAFISEFSVDKSKTTFNSNNENSSKQNNFNANFSLPTSIYFTIKF